MSSRTAAATTRAHSTLVASLFDTVSASSSMTTAAVAQGCRAIRRRQRMRELALRKSTRARARSHPSSPAGQDLTKSTRAAHSRELRKVVTNAREERSERSSS